MDHQPKETTSAAPAKIDHGCWHCWGLLRVKGQGLRFEINYIKNSKNITRSSDNQITGIMSNYMRQDKPSWKHDSEKHNIQSLPFTSSRVRFGSLLFHLKTEKYNIIQMTENLPFPVFKTRVWIVASPSEICLLPHGTDTKKNKREEKEERQLQLVLVTISIMNREC